MAKHLFDPQQYKDRPELTKLFEESKKLVDAMTPEEKEEMYRLQRESWARQDMD